MTTNSNFCTLNINAQISSGTFSLGNLLFKHTSSAWRSSIGTIAVSSGKWYWEALQDANESGNGFPIGVYDLSDGKFASAQEANYPGQAISTYGTSYAIYSYGTSTRSAYQHNGTETAFTNLGTGAAGDVWQCALDLDNGKLFFGKNNTWDNSANPATGTNPVSSTITTTSKLGWTPITCSYSSTSSETYAQNFGQDSNFAGLKSTGTASSADGNGFGDFYYAPPSGFLALCSNNLPISADIDPAGDDGTDENPTKQFNAITYTGTGSSQAISGLGFKPDLVWIKDLSSGENNRVTDSSRGVTKAVRSDLANAEITDSGGVTAFGTDGFTVGDHNNYNASTNSLVAWCWKANGGTTSTNTDGTITSTVQANTKGGFSIVTYTGTGSAGTLGHGLGKAPEWIIVKNRDAGDDWAAYHVSNGNTHYMTLNTNAGKSDNTYWNDTSPTSSVFSIGTDHKVNASTEKYVAYCWSAIEGYSKFGFYASNQNANGPFNYTGFRPKMIFVKMVVSGDGWGVWDSTRSTSNLMNEALRWDSDNAQATGTAYQVDFLANGFKIRTDNAQMNHNSYDPYIWGAWGDVPYKYSNAF